MNDDVFLLIDSLCLNDASLSVEEITRLLNKCDIDQKYNNDVTPLMILLTNNKFLNVPRDVIFGLLDKCDLNKRSYSGTSVLGSVLIHNESSKIKLSPDQIIYLLRKKYASGDNDNYDFLNLLFIHNDTLKIPSKEIISFLDEIKFTEITGSSAWEPFAFLFFYNKKGEINVPVEKMVDIIRRCDMSMTDSFKKPLFEYLIENNKIEGINVPTNVFFELFEKYVINPVKKVEGFDVRLISSLLKNNIPAAINLNSKQIVRVLSKSGFSGSASTINNFFGYLGSSFTMEDQDLAVVVNMITQNPSLDWKLLDNDVVKKIKVIKDFDLVNVRVRNKNKTKSNIKL